MAYFSNGTEGEDAQREFCDTCVHSHGCPVWWLHIIWNYEACRDETKREALEILWPDRINGVLQSCAMYHRKPIPKTGVNMTDALKKAGMEGNDE